MGGGGQEEDDDTMVLFRTVRAGDSNNNSNHSTSSDGASKTLQLCMLGCESNPPYGPNAHTARLLLDIIGMAAEEHLKNTSTSTPTSTTSFNIAIHVFHVQQDDPYPSDWDAYDGFLLPGSFSSAYDTDPWIETFKQVLQEQIVAHERSALAICFGHQVLAHSFETGHATAVPSGARVGRHAAKCTKAGAKLLQKETIDLFFSHGDMVERLPSSALCLAGNDAVPIQAAAYFGSAQAAEQFERRLDGEDNSSSSAPSSCCSKPFCISFQAHPEYASSQALGVETTLGGCMTAMEKRGNISAEAHSVAKQDANETFGRVQRDSIEVVVQAGRWLGWFPDDALK